MDFIRIFFFCGKVISDASGQKPPDEVTKNDIQSDCEP